VPFISADVTKAMRPVGQC